MQKVIHPHNLYDEILPNNHIFLIFSKNDEFFNFLKWEKVDDANYVVDHIGGGSPWILYKNGIKKVLTNINTEYCNHIDRLSCLLA